MIYSCQICTNEYNMGENLPKILGKCGHTICKICLSYQIQCVKNSNLSFENWLLKCPFDNTTYLIKKKSNADDFPKNFFLIDLIQNTIKNKKPVKVERESLKKIKVNLPPKTLKQRYQEDYGVKLDDEKLKNQEAFRNKQQKRKIKNNIKVFVSDKHIKYFNKNLNSLKQKIINKKITKNFIEKNNNNKKANFLKNKANFDKLFLNLKKNRNKKVLNKIKLINKKNKSKANLKSNKSRKKLEFTKNNQNIILNFKKKKSKKSFKNVQKSESVISNKNLLKKFKKDLKVLSRSKKKIRREKIKKKNNKKLNLINKIRSKLNKNLPSKYNSQANNNLSENNNLSINNNLSVDKNFSVNKNLCKMKNSTRNKNLSENQNLSINKNLYNTQYEDSLQSSIILDYNQRQSNLLSESKILEKKKHFNSEYSFNFNNLNKNQGEKIELIPDSDFSLNSNNIKRDEKQNYLIPLENSKNLYQKKNNYFSKKNKLLYSHKNINLSLDKIKTFQNNISNSSNNYFERYSNFSQNEKIRYSQTPDLVSKNIIKKQPNSNYFFNMKKKNIIYNQKKEILKIKDQFTKLNSNSNGFKNHVNLNTSNLKQNNNLSKNFIDSKVLNSKKTSASNVKDNYNKNYSNRPLINFYLNN